MMTDTLITETAWKVIDEEISFFADHPEGNREGVVYPLFSWLKKENCEKSPWEILELEDLDCFVVTHALTLPHEYAKHSRLRASFVAASEEERLHLVQLVTSWRDDYNKSFPNLELGYVHSHWFAKGWTSPSYGKDCDYPRIYQLWQDLLKYNLNTPLEIIICRSWGKNYRWKPCSFGFGQKQQIISLGEAKIVPDDDSRVKKILTIPYDLTEAGQCWEEKEFPVETFKINRSKYGSSYVKLFSDGNHLALHFPYYFPGTDKINYQRYNPVLKKWRKGKLMYLANSSFELKSENIINDIFQGEIYG